MPVSVYVKRAAREPTGFSSVASAMTTAQSASWIGGDVDYNLAGHGYAQQRRADPRIASMILDALGDARTVVNVGAGAGSYEPIDRHVVPIEPSQIMRSQRPAHLAPAVHGAAESLPLDDRSVDAAMATLTVHQWTDWRKGLSELRRVSRGPVVILTFDGDAMNRFWLAPYVPEMIREERRRMPPISAIVEALGGTCEVAPVRLAIDCADGFTEAYYARPEAFLDERVRRGQSAWRFVEAGVEDRFVRQLADDLRSGAWDRRHGHLRSAPYFEGAVRLIVGRPG